MLCLKNISKSFPSVFEPVLKNINLELKTGDFCVVIGSNGSGKSTLIKTVSGEYSSDSGTLFLNNQNITNLSLHKRAKFISSVAQDVSKGVVQEMTLLENLALSQKRGYPATYSFYKRQSEFLREKVASLGLGLENYLHTPLSQLSGGQRQMIATLMATLNSPPLLLLDEHCSALDPKTQSMVMEYTADIINKQNITALMITHHLGDAIRYGNRLLMLHQGAVVLDVQDAQKQTLKISTLLDLFHRYEDTVLAEGVI